ncbi:MAG TPA: MFS transporter [Vicinamibacterales bacterium]|jgi:SHS family lactate transporter-like MFS transporter|nr:MFS transporter [Vicinamibacterales bacterium]
MSTPGGPARRAGSGAERALTPEQRTNQRNAVLAGFLGWTLDAFDYFVLTFIVEDVAHAFGKTRPDIAWTITLTLAMRPVGAIVFGLMADRWGRRLPLMLNVIFYAVISVLSGLAPSYRAFLILRMLFGIGMGGEWGTGAALALEAVSAKWRGLFSGLLQEGYALGGFLAALAFRLVYVPLHAANPDQAWRYMFFLGGIPALLSLFIRAKVKESDAWHEHKTDWKSYGHAIAQNWRRFLYLVAMMAMMNFISHGSQDMYPTFLQHERGYSAVGTSNLSMIGYAGAILGGLLFGYWSDRAGRRKAMVVSAFFALVIIPLWIAAPSTALIALGVFLMQFFVQGAWGVVPAHINELSPSALRGFFPGFAYQLGNLCASSVGYIESSLGEHFTYAQSMGVLMAAVLVIGGIVIAMGPEEHGVNFRRS